MNILIRNIVSLFIYLFIYPFICVMGLLIDRSYPVTVKLKDRYLGSCKNKKLKTLAEFTVDRKKADINSFPWQFRAYLGKTELSWLGAGDKSKNKGVCNNVKTEDHSMGCGLATTLMELSLIHI